MSWVADPKGYFTICISKERKVIVVKHFDNAGDKIGEFEFKTARDAKSKLVGKVSRLDHAFYLGQELMRAELALKNEWLYEQDD